MILDKFFLKYERGWGGGSQIDSHPPNLPPEKTTLTRFSFIRKRNDGIIDGNHSWGLISYNDETLTI